MTAVIRTDEQRSQNSFVENVFCARASRKACYVSEDYKEGQIAFMELADVQEAVSGDRSKHGSTRLAAAMDNRS